MFYAQITIVSLMDLPHVVTESWKVAEWRRFITDITTVFEKILIGLFDLIAAKPDLELSLKLPISEHPVAKLLIKQDRVRKNHLENIITGLNYNNYYLWCKTKKLR